ncbi:hypothetical protein [Microcystis aeruginosa]|nr:hypothetical protein [Microcystis aeruginosa]MDB9416544.1 hypothetical protein [Microcystis aeruginosa CS-556/03]
MGLELALIGLYTLAAGKSLKAREKTKIAFIPLIGDFSSYAFSHQDEV